MSNQERIYIDEPLWDIWYVDEFIGKGNSGYVYKVSSEDSYGHEMIAAVKALYIRSIAHNQDIKTLISNVLKEVRRFNNLGNKKNILIYKEQYVLKDKSNMGYNIYLKTDYLQSLDNYFYQIGKPMKVKHAIKMAMNICNVLEECRTYKIYHKNIKESNIFLTRNGSLKLADFSFSDSIKNVLNNYSSKKTSSCIAPESYYDNKYDEKSDMYSLGLVLYRLFNDGRMPLLPDYPINYSKIEEGKAFKDRVNGMTFPPPKKANNNLQGIIMKACHYNISLRYSSLSEFKNELFRLYSNMPVDEKERLIRAKDVSSNNIYRTPYRNKILGSINDEESKKKVLSTIAFTFICLTIIFTLLSANNTMQNWSEKNNGKTEDNKIAENSDMEQGEFIINFSKNEVVNNVSRTVANQTPTPEITNEESPTPSLPTGSTSPATDSPESSESPIKVPDFNGNWSGSITGNNGSYSVTISINQNVNTANYQINTNYTGAGEALLSTSFSGQGIIVANSFTIVRNPKPNVSETWTISIPNGQKKLTVYVSYVDSANDINEKFSGQLQK